MAFRKRSRSSRRFRPKARRSMKSSRKTTRSFKARVTQVLMKKAETKYFDIAEENVQLYHSNGTTSTAPSSVVGSLTTLFNPWADIYRGTARQDRVGDQITPRGMSLSIWFANKLDRPNVMYRVIIARVPKNITGTTTTASNVYPFTDVNLGSGANQLILPLDKDRGIKPFYDKVFNLQLGTSNVTVPILGYAGKEAHMVKRFWIKSKGSRPISYDPASAIGSIGAILNNPLMVWVIPYDSYGTLKTDNIASCSYHARLYFKDV